MNDAPAAQSAAYLQAENSALRARLAATDEVLRAIAAGPADPQPVFDLIVRRVRELAGATTASIFRHDGALLHRLADDGHPPEVLAALRAAYPRRPSADNIPGRVVLSGDVVRIANSATDPDVIAPLRDPGARSYLGVPLRREGSISGVLTIGRADLRPFDEDAVALAWSFAEQAVIAMETARLLAEQRDALDRQAAMAEVLDLVNRAALDLPLVLRTLVESAARLCDAEQVVLFRYQDGTCHYLAGRGNTPEYERFEREHPIPPGRDTLVGRAMLERQPVQIPDVQADPDYGPKAIAGSNGGNAMLGVPLLRDGALIGVFGLARRRVGPFSAREVALVSDFAAQAAIALGNARLVDALRERTAELQEALDYQTATGEVLQLISRATFDLQPVLQTLAETMARLCDAEMAFILRKEGEEFRAAAAVGHSAEFQAYLEAHPLAAGRGTVTGRVALEKRPVQIADVVADPEFTLTETTTMSGQRTALGVPLLRDGALLGVIVLARRRVLPFTERQIALVRTFADQAVIAIENTRLLTEQHDALERQTATAEVLEAINANQGEILPVFDIILAKAHALCGAEVGALYQPDGAGYRAVATRGYSAEIEAVLREPRPPSRRVHALLAGARCQHAVDLLDAGELGWRDAAIAKLGVRTSLLMPLREDGALLGWISANRFAVRPFTEAQIALLESFAAQAVIAIRNARLLRELRESLEYQSAISGLLRIVSGSLGDLAPVFDGILERAHALCGAEQGSLQLFDGAMSRAVAVRNLPKECADLMQAGYALPPEDAPTDRVRHILDTQELLSKGLGGPMLRLIAEQTGLRTSLRVPLMKDGKALGRIVAGRREVRPFEPKQIALLENFADQAVLAIENARLVEDLRARTAELAERNDAFAERIEHQAATIDVLKVMSSSPGDPQPVFDLIAERARAVCQAPSAAVFIYDGRMVHLRAERGLTKVARGDDHLDRYRALFPMPLSEGSLICRSVLHGRIVHSRDVGAEPGLFPEVYAAGAGSSLSVPMLRDGAVLGTVTLSARATGGFSDSQVELLRTFAEQAVIAITSAETYRALQQRTAELAERNEAFRVQVAHQAATIDVLKVMSSSTSDTQPVFEMILRRAMALCGSAYGNMHEFDGTLVHFRAHAGWEDEAALRRYAAMFPSPPDTTTSTSRAILARRTLYFPDFQAVEGLSPRVKELGIGSAVAVPLLRNGAPIGSIALAHRDKDGINPAQIALLETFAEQAVIAIGSVATFKALQQRTEELARSVRELQALEKVGRAVNASLDLDTVLATVIERSVRLGDADEGTLYEYDAVEEVFVPKAAHGMTAERVEALRARRVRKGETHLGRAAAERRPVQVADLPSDPTLAAESRGLLPGIHAVLAVPLLREETVIGGLVIRRRASGEFEASTVTLLQTFAAQCVLAIENARLFAEVRHARAEAESALADLRRTQDRLIQTEKLASLGQLTAGIAHEIKNPLNFVNNFAELSVELLAELEATAPPERLAADPALRKEVAELTATLRGNLEKIQQHGRRADSIVRNMLLHSRSGAGEQAEVDLNALAEEALNLAYHGERAAMPDFTVRLERALDPLIGTVKLHPQEITRALLNLIGNGFHAARQRGSTAGASFEPTLRIATCASAEEVEIRVRDNGTGIPPELRDRIFQPFFTTKPAGEGTGLGLSLTHDIVVKQHGGSLEVESEVGAFTEFVITLPRRVRRGG